MMSQIYRSFIGRTLPDRLLDRLPDNVYTCSDVMFALSPLIFSDLTDAETIEQILAAKPNLDNTILSTSET